MLTGYLTTLPQDVLLSAGVIYYQKVNTYLPVGVTDGAPDFDAASEQGEIMFDNRAPSRLKGLTRVVGYQPVFKGTLKELGPSASGNQVKVLEPGESEATASGVTTVTPKPAGVMMAVGDYLVDFRWIFERAGGGYACIYAPLAICRKWSAKGVDKKEAQFAFEIEAVGDPANDLSAAPYVIELRTTIPTQDGSPADVRATIGDSNIVAYWDMSAAYVAQSSGAASVQDVRGGTFPTMTFHGASHPSYDAVNGEVSLNGTDQYGDAPSLAVFDFSSAITMVLLGSVISGGSNGYMGIGRDIILTGPYINLAQFGTFTMIGASNNATSRSPVDTAKHLHIAFMGNVKGGVTTVQPYIGVEIFNHLHNVVQVNALAAGNNIVYLGRAGGVYAQMAVRAMLIIRKELTAADMAALRRMSTARGLTLAASSKRALFIGDSLTSGFGSTANHDYPTVLAGAILGSYEWENDGAAGRQAAELFLLADSIYVPQIFGPNTVCYVWAGTNDLNNYATGTIIANLQNLCQKLRLAGAKVIVGTITNRLDTNVAAPQATVNAAIRTFVANFYADAMVDLQADANLNDPNNTTYFNADKLHLTDAGYARVAALMQAASSGLI